MPSRMVVPEKTKVESVRETSNARRVLTAYHTKSNEFQNEASIAHYHCKLTQQFSTKPKHKSINIKTTHTHMHTTTQNYTTNTTHHFSRWD